MGARLIDRYVFIPPNVQLFARLQVWTLADMELDLVLVFYVQCRNSALVLFGKCLNR